MIKKAYRYVFYKIYKFSEAAPSRWLSDWKAELVLDVLWIFIAFSLLVYYTIFTGKSVSIGDGKFVIILAIVIFSLPNYLMFHHKSQWKQIVHEFDKLPKRTNRVGGWLVFSVVLIVLINLIFSVYLMSQVNLL